jgi:non-ribosomal peptide synthetase component E (peptide arylation enzyme)
MQEFSQVISRFFVRPSSSVFLGTPITAAARSHNFMLCSPASAGVMLLAFAVGPPSAVGASLALIDRSRNASCNTWIVPTSVTAGVRAQSANVSAAPRDVSVVSIWFART